MVSVRNLVFNAFQVNTYFLYDETGECLIIDAACSDDKEEGEIVKFIESNNLRPVANINTHCHIDHILGNGFIEKQYGLRPRYHKASAPFFHTTRELASSFGYTLENIPEPGDFIEEGTKIVFGNSSVDVLYTPGHAEGSVCFYNKDEGFVITGDVLFRETIGRTDLPSGDFRLLMQSITGKLFKLPDDTVVYPGHGPSTTIGFEKMNNPFIR